MTTQRKPKTVTIQQAEYSALLGVVAAHRADSALTPSKVLEHYDSVTRKPSQEVDHGGRVYYVEAGKVYEGRRTDFSCEGCAFERMGNFCLSLERRSACAHGLNGERGFYTLHPVRAVG